MVEENILLSGKCIQDIVEVILYTAEMQGAGDNFNSQQT